MRGNPHQMLALGAAALLLALAGCSPAQDQRPTPSPSPPPPTAQVTPTASSTVPPNSTTPIPFMRPSGSDHIPEKTRSEPPASSPAGPTTTAALSIYYVAVGDQGQSGPEIGCGDSLISTQSAPQTFTDKVKAALELLLGDKSADYGQTGLRNAVADSMLRFVSSSVSGDIVIVNLSGRISSGGTCDDPRIIEQISRTASTAAGVDAARILVNGIPINVLLGEK